MNENKGASHCSDGAVRILTAEGNALAAKSWIVARGTGIDSADAEEDASSEGGGG